MPSDAHSQNNGFSELLDAIKDIALVFLSAHLNELFGNTDKALLDFAERAENNAVQGRFFEAMGFVRRYRTELEHRFRKEIGRAYEQFGHYQHTEVVDADDGVEMSLMGQEEMEESVPIENLILRTQGEHHQQLYALHQRLAVLNHGRKLEDEQIPCGPAHLVHSFRNAIGSLSIDVKAKLVLYALFDKFVLHQLNDLYSEFNGSLKQAGILPNLKPLFTRSGSRSPKPEQERPATDKGRTPTEQPKEQTSAFSGNGGGGSESPPSLGEELFTSILQLMAARRQPQASGGQSVSATARNHRGPTKPRGMGSGNAAADKGGAPAIRQQLITTIEDLLPPAVGQGQGVLSNLDALPQVAVDPHFLDHLKHALEQEREQIFSRVDREQISKVDADTIDLIGMLFEYMLNDPLLPNVAKALLSHLHTPYLKLSLTDRRLLKDSEHPARVLLDMLVEAGGQWVYENDINRGIFPRMRTVVDRVLQESRDNAKLFVELIDYFQAATEEQRRKTESIEQRSKESAKGREKLNVAKQQAAKEITSRLKRARLPKPVRRFLSEAWIDRLVFVLLRHNSGELSNDWHQALQTADDLIWLFEPASAQADEVQIRQVSQRIRKAVSGTQDASGGYHQNYLEELFHYLDDPSAIADWHADNYPGPYSDPLLLPDSQSLLEQSSASPRVLPGAPPPAAAMVTGGAPETASGPENTVLDESENLLLKSLQNLEFGTWFEFKDDDNRVRRVKLSWLSPLTSTCMFVDRSGIQAEIKPLAEVAHLVANDKAKIIPQPRHRFVERAMLAIKNTLQRTMEATD